MDLGGLGRAETLPFACAGRREPGAHAEGQYTLLRFGAPGSVAGPGAGEWEVLRR